MYSKTTILTAASGIVGYRLSTDSNYASIPTYLKSSNSGFYVNDLQISLELINDAKKEQTFANYLNNIHNAEIVNVVNRFIDKQKTKLNSKELLSNVTMIQRFNDLRQPITKNSKFIGYAITPRESKSINITITQIGLQSSASESLTLYLFDPSQQTAIQSKTVTCSGKSVTWTDLDWDIEFDKSDGTAGSTYLIGFFEDDLSGQLYAQDWELGMAHQSMRITRHYAGLSPVRIPNNQLNGTSLPDMQYLEGALSCKSSGFNLRFNIKCDISDVLVDNINMFGEAVQYAVAIRILKDAMGNIGLNHTISSAQNRETFERLITDYEGMLYGGFIEDVGYRKGLLDNLAIDFSEIDAVCLKPVDGKISQVKW